MAEEPEKPPGETAKRRTRREVDADTNTYSEFKSDGKRKAHAADAIRSYDDFRAMLTQVSCVFRRQTDIPFGA